MDQIQEFFKEVNSGQLFIIGVMFWFFYKSLDSKIDNIEAKLSTEIDGVEKNLTAKIVEAKLTAKIDVVEAKLIIKIAAVEEKLSTKIEDVARRLCRMEGSLATQGHCLFHSQKQDKKAK